MGKPRIEYAYVAHRLNESNPQNLGMYSIYRRKTRMIYHFDPRTQRLINRNSWAMPIISRGSRIWDECMRAIQRLVDEGEA